MTDQTAAPQTRWSLRVAPLGHGLLLGLFCLATALILSLVDEATREAIAAREAEDLAASLAQVIPAELHDGDLDAATFVLEDTTEGPITVYRATRDGTVTAVAFELTGYGYGGAIVVLVGLDPQGVLLGTRVLSHTETPGLGDKIEAARSDWIHRFTGLSLGNPPAERWTVRKSGGDFDQFSGATITPRVVVETIRRGLFVHARNRDTLFSNPGETG